MAKFYRITKFSGVQIHAIPKGWRGIGAFGFHPLEGRPYNSQASIPFDVKIRYENDVDDDLRELAILGGNLDGSIRLPTKQIHIKGNKELKYEIPINDGAEHDDRQMIYQIHFPRKGKWERLVYSKPWDSNLWPVTFISLVTGLILAGLIFWLDWN
jgi:hypothetical protein